MRGHSCLTHPAGDSFLQDLALQSGAPQLGLAGSPARSQGGLPGSPPPAVPSEASLNPEEVGT